MQKYKGLRRLVKPNTIVILIVLFAVAFVLIQQQSNINYYNRQISQLQKEIEAEEKLADELTQKESVYSSDYYVEKVAREELGLVMPDEKVFVDANGK